MKPEQRLRELLAAAQSRGLTSVLVVPFADVEAVLDRLAVLERAEVERGHYREILRALRRLPAFQELADEGCPRCGLDGAHVLCVRKERDE